MTWKLWFLLIILGGAGLAYVLGSRPRKYRPLSGNQPGAILPDEPKPELGMEAIDMDVVKEAQAKNSALGAMTGGSRNAVGGRQPNPNASLNSVVGRFGVKAMRKKFGHNRDKYGRDI
ncbi:hypothetical protein K3729_09670 [Rhodobacteraceae bacterium S2214]|nr:hypothetical protein K3729_09670 [Rhodobacteraceae bacterium S2214]